MEVKVTDSPPEAFGPEAVASASQHEDRLFSSFWRSGQPLKSMLENNPWLQPPNLARPLAWGGGEYWDTTIGSEHPYWRDQDLPRATQDIVQLRKDFERWGYCLIEDGLSPTQCQAFLKRLLDQAAGEASAGIEQITPSGQYVNTLVNKGEQFVGCIQHDPRAVQAGPLLEQLTDEALGKGWICHSFLANGADPGGYPQALHMDQGPLLPWVTHEAPALVNTMFIPQDVDANNGGTLIIPGSHKDVIKAGSGGVIGALAPTINLEAKAGTIVFFDGRLIHGTGVNRSNRKRFVATMSNVKPWMRTQENWVVSVAPDVLAEASPKLRHRLGLQALVYGGTIEGFGLTGNGRLEDPWGDIRTFRDAIDQGSYVRVRALSGNAASDELQKNYTVGDAMKRAKTRHELHRQRTKS
jgi:ectoine hydroxylase-related dioxygenase (phytanoyl-CoA dioxygenase family)